jgi:hypothetical protein
MNPIADLTISAMLETGNRLPSFQAMLSSAFDDVDIPFGQAWYADLYRKKATDPRWFATSLILNAEKEGEGARRLWKMAAVTADKDAAEQVRLHAIDEARHARIYIAMLDTTFPGCVDSELRRHLDGISPGYTLQDFPTRGDELMDLSYTLDELIQMNMGEIRTRINQLMMEPMVLAHCAPKERPKISKMLNSIVGDETKHICYTARLIEKAMNSGHAGLVRDLLFQRLRQFCALTLNEVGAGVFEGS